MVQFLEKLVTVSGAATGGWSQAPLPRRSPLSVRGREGGDLSPGSDLLPPLGNLESGLWDAETRPPTAQRESAGWGRSGRGRREDGRDGGGAAGGSWNCQSWAPANVPYPRYRCCCCLLPSELGQVLLVAGQCEAAPHSVAGSPGMWLKPKEVLVKNPEALGGPEEQQLLDATAAPRAQRGDWPPQRRCRRFLQSELGHVRPWPRLREQGHQKKGKEARRGAAEGRPEALGDQEEQRLLHPRAAWREACELQEKKE
ncbi:uncharacterized protein LOC124974510 [Sciurus carolinensis]|uniref:uncharacterized protein LOC124974510 n=1 Tax=Sciurus carolinensis TaxID=30640 RepID=UPI001FB2A568|nr:uncharacterized protein LOC124974510 [Sciurus carolinensis]